MRKLFFHLIFVLLSIQVIGQEYKYINVDTLNIREGAGKKFKIVGYALQGDKVKFFNDSNNWSLIETENGIKGYASSRYLIDSINPKEKSEEKSQGTGPWGGIIFVLCILGFIAYKLWRFFSSPSTNNSKSSGKSPSISWWHCRDCHMMVKTNRKPSVSNCKVNYSHRWYSLGELGERTYVCNVCGMQVQTKKEPTNLYCNGNGAHQWKKY